jgi:hypothetical protein
MGEEIGWIACGQSTLRLGGLRLTIISSDDDDSAHTPNAGAKKSVDDTDKTAREKSLDSIREMYAALRACWTPPPKDDARHGME